jgi:hypothetical protein
MALRTVIIAVITEVLDFYNRNGVFILRRSTWGCLRRLVAGGRRPLTAWARPWGVALRCPFLWIRWFHVGIIQSVWGLLVGKVALGHPRCSPNNSDFPCQDHSLAVHIRSVMEKGAPVQVSVWVVWLSAALSFSPLEICGKLRGALTNFSPSTPVVLCHCFLSFVDRASRYNSCKLSTWRTVIFFVYVYSKFLHVSSTHVLIIRRINCINTTSGICHSM